MHLSCTYRGSHCEEERVPLGALEEPFQTQQHPYTDSHMLLPGVGGVLTTTLRTTIQSL